MSQINTADSHSGVNLLEGKVQEKHFIEDEIFSQLLAIREEVYQATEINVSPRKLVNLLLKQSDLEGLRDQLIKQYR